MSTGTVSGHCLSVFCSRALCFSRALGGQAGLSLRGAALISTIFEEMIGKGIGDAYFPVIARLIDPPRSSG
ncbi:hypothetical protein [Bradyrhizobium liaoningense]|uniref:hypothetical protein n=1 Tax=Bradyrhizobium liaoningense TaxID=43992 RepID=UPI001BAA4533|nr:hypothetical protein [Bradyrhizobium liaoningense]MBR0717136.1 hypothetical protein [Bradyrhizobium liaoningense]